MSRGKELAWIIIFVMIIVLPYPASFALGKHMKTENNENRTLQERPILTSSNYETFSKEFENYFNDNIPFRNQLIRLNNSIDYFIFNRSSSEKVLVGKNGWLFYPNNADRNPVEQSLGYWNFTDTQLQTIAENLTSTKRVLESMGIEFILFIAPNKETIYMDELPDYYDRRSNYTSTDQLVDYLRENTDICILYPKDELINERQKNPDILLYYKLDTHWNSVGGYIAAECIADELDIKMPALSEITIDSEYSSNGDLTEMLNITINNGDINYKLTGISELNTYCEKHDSFTEFIYHTPGTDTRRLFVKRDSFSTALAPLLATQFENSIWVHNNHFEQQQIFDYNADIFILETVERGERSLAEFKISL